jgi:hypothetical protein
VEVDVYVLLFEFFFLPNFISGSIQSYSVLNYAPTEKFHLMY